MENGMPEYKNYVRILLESLRKKILILDEIIEKTKEQQELIKKEQLDMDAFGKNVDEKDVLIQRLMDLDNGFSVLYERVKEELNLHKDRYTDEIIVMKKYIADITAKSMSIQAEEKRNHEVIQKHFITIRKQINQKAVSRKVAMGYYNNMSKLNVVSSQFLDKKK